MVKECIVHVRSHARVTGECWRTISLPQKLQCDVVKAFNSGSLYVYLPDDGLVRWKLRENPKYNSTTSTCFRGQFLI